MSTPAAVLIYNKETDTYRGIHIHWDGYPCRTGKFLYKFYRTTDRVEKLISLGYLTEIGPRIGKKIDFDINNYAEITKFHMDKSRLQCIAYYRDMDDKDLTIDTYIKAEVLGHHTNAVYTYVWKNDQWYIVAGNVEKSWKKLEKVLINEGVIAGPEKPTDIDDPCEIPTGTEPKPEEPEDVPAYVIRNILSTLTNRIKTNKDYLAKILRKEKTDDNINTENRTLQSCIDLIKKETKISE